jgi:serine/threonine protein kinase
MSFGEPASCDANQSRDDDGTQNTSISSLSADGHHHMAPVPGALPPTILDLHPPHNDVDDADSVRPIHAKLFAEEEDFGYSDDDDDSQSSPARDIVGRTRLNFNTVLSPDKVGFNTRDAGTFVVESHFSLSTNSAHHAAFAETTIDLTQTYDQRRINSFPSSLSSSTHLNNISACEVVGGSLTPTRRLSDKFLPTLTPREVQVHFPLEDECSPIPGFKEDPTRCEIHESMPTPSDDSDPLPARTHLSMQTVMETGDSSTNMDSVIKEESSTGSGSVNGKSRGLRPMPDISAFETNAPSSRGERSSDDSATSDGKGIASTHRLTCPPTPVRTPAWANDGGHPFFGRQSSLITTKVLLSVPSQVLEGRCSLENSFLDDDSTSSNHGSSAILGKKKTRLENESNSFLGGLTAPSLPVRAPLHHEPESAVKVPKLQEPPRLMRRVPPGQEIDSIVSFSHDFEILSLLGRGAFADVYKVRSVRDNRLYAVKRNRRQFRGKRDRDMALTEVQAMQRLQRVCGEVDVSNSQERNSYSLYLLFFYRAWQEDGYLLCQTELCSRDTCRELIDSLRFFWNNTKIKYPSLNTHYPTCQLGSIEESPARSVPNDTVWKICHDIAAGLSHIHSHGMVHHDIKPSNIFFVAHPRFGAMCKIGDFGMAGDIGTSADGLEGDARYMSPELLSSGVRQPSSDIFSLGLTIYEIAADLQTEMPSEGPEWHFLRSLHGPILPRERGQDLLQLVQQMTYPTESQRPTAEDILKREDVLAAGKRCDRFLQDYLHDIEVFDQKEEERLAMDCQEDQTPRNGSHRMTMPVRSPSLSMLISNPPNLLSPVGKCIH